jgi:SAM-dependent methyltransferase
VHWILALVFLRFLEDNRLVDAPLLSGPGERLELAELRQRAFFNARPHDSDAEFLLASLDEAAKLPGLTGLYDPAHNPLFRLPVSGDGAMALLAFFRASVPETGALVHEFTDPEWNTRFLGDLYQDLSEDARKRYALLQTPDFVEEWILSRTLDPAIAEFGFEHVRMIDPACGSGHFLLGGFARLLAEWQRHALDMPPAAQAQRALDAVSGVDLNPFAVEVARFRLLLAALRAAEKTRLAEAPDFKLSLAVGDSLFHGTHFFRGELGGAPEGFGRRLQHHFVAEDTATLDILLGRQYHAVVGNPPYITPKDSAMRQAYREIYSSCHMKYALVVPFVQRFFDLAQSATGLKPAGFVGLIVADSFAKREFGSKLVENVLPNLDLTHVVDCSDAHIPSHGGTGILILFGRNRSPSTTLVRAVMRIRGEALAPDDPAHGPVWSAITSQVDRSGSTSGYVTADDVLRSTLAKHPWSLGGGGAFDVHAKIEKGRPQLASATSAIGVFGMTNADDVMLAGSKDLLRAGCEQHSIWPIVVGDAVRDWKITEGDSVIFPYSGYDLIKISDLPGVERWLWPSRTVLGNRATFSQQTYFAEGRPWWEWHQVAIERLAGATITIGEQATHNHFVLDKGGKVFKQTAPIIVPIQAPIQHGNHREPHRQRGSLLDADHPSNGVLFPRRITRRAGQPGLFRLRWRDGALPRALPGRIRRSVLLLPGARV